MEGAAQGGGVVPCCSAPRQYDELDELDGVLGKEEGSARRASVVERLESSRDELAYECAGRLDGQPVGKRGRKVVVDLCSNGRVLRAERKRTERKCWFDAAKEDGRARDEHATHLLGTGTAAQS